MGLTLREGNREYFYEQLDRLFPGLKEKYMRLRGNQYVLGSPRNDELMRLFHRRCAQAKILHDNAQIFSYLNAFEEKDAGTQLSLFN